MSLNKPLAEKCSVALALVALAVLAINYGLLVVEALSVSAGAISFEGVKANGMLLPVAAIGALVGLAICHLRHHAPSLMERFSKGYREAPLIVERVRVEVATAAEDPKYGAPYGGLRGSLKRLSQDLGRFTRPGGTLSKPVIITPSTAEHWSAVRSGVLRLLGRGFWLSVYLPLLFAIWALATIAV